MVERADQIVAVPVVHTVVSVTAISSFRSGNRSSTLMCSARGKKRSKSEVSLNIDNKVTLIVLHQGDRVAHCRSRHRCLLVGSCSLLDTAG